MVHVACGHGWVPGGCRVYPRCPRCAHYTGWDECIYDPVYEALLAIIAQNDPFSAKTPQNGPFSPQTVPDGAISDHGTR